MAFCPNCGKEVPAEASFCWNCGRSLRQPQAPSEQREKVSAWWWLLPFFLGIIGGIVGFVVLERRNRRTATWILVFGVVWTVVGTLLIGIIIAGFAFGLFGTYSNYSYTVSVSSATCTAATSTCTLLVTNGGYTPVTPTSCQVHLVQAYHFSSVPIPAGGNANEICVAAGGPFSVGTPVVGSLTLSNGATVPFDTNWS